MNSKQNYSKFGEHLHYLTPEKLQVFWEAVDDSRDKLILKLIFELGCRVGEFTKIQLKQGDGKEECENARRILSYSCHWLPYLSKTVQKPAWLLSFLHFDIGTGSCTGKWHVLDKIL